MGCAPWGPWDLEQTEHIFPLNRLNHDCLYCLFMPGHFLGRAASSRSRVLLCSASIPGELWASPLPSRSLRWLRERLCASTNPACSASLCPPCCGRAGRKPGVVSPPCQPPLVTAAGQTRPGIPGRLLPTEEGSAAVSLSRQGWACPDSCAKALGRGQAGHQGAAVPLVPAAGPRAPLWPTELAPCLAWSCCSLGGPVQGARTGHWILGNEGQTSLLFAFLRACRRDFRCFWVAVWALQMTFPSEAGFLVGLWWIFGCSG